MAINTNQIRAIFPTCPWTRANFYQPYLAAAMTEFGVSLSIERAADFLANIGEETGELKWMTELASGWAYEGRLDLGNTQPGDGPRFKGRGAFQLTGRANYAKYGGLLGVDLIAHPEWASLAHQTFRVAGLYWKLHNCNTKADAGDFLGIVRAINGGTTGLNIRQAYRHKALHVFGVNG